MKYYDSVKWLVNDSCNLNCPFCLVQKTHKISQSLEEQFQVLDKLNSEGVHYIDFFGKEPLFDDRIFDIMKYGEEKNYDFYYTFISNGKNLKKYTDRILNSPCIDFTISYDFHSGDREYQFNLEDLLPFKDKCYIELSIDVHRDNRLQILSGLTPLKEYGVNSLYFKPILPYGKEIEPITEEEYTSFIYSVFMTMRFQRNMDLRFSIPYQMERLTKDPHRDYFFIEPTCKAGIESFCIDSQGTAFGCATQCVLNDTLSTCDYLKTPLEELASILRNHQGRKRMCEFGG